MNPVMALGMKENAVRGTSGTALHTGDAVMQAPACDPSDFCIALRAKSTLFIPEIAKSAGTAFRSQSGLPTIRTQGCRLSNVDPLGTEPDINSERIVAVSPSG